MAAYNLMYAESIPELAPKVEIVTNGRAVDALSDDQQNQVRALLISNETYDFGSGAWFLSQICSDSIRQQLQLGSEAGWEAYLSDSGCVGTTVTQDRTAYWRRAMQILGVQ